MICKRHLWHDIDLPWVIESWDEDPLSLVSEVLKLLVPDNVAELLEVAANLLERCTVPALLRDESTRAHNNGWKHAIEAFEELFECTDLPRVVQMKLTEDNYRLLGLENVALVEMETGALR